MLSRTLPAGFIAPCPPNKAPRPPSGALWLHEIKHDGFRVIARKDGDLENGFATSSGGSKSANNLKFAIFPDNSLPLEIPCSLKSIPCFARKIPCFVRREFGCKRLNLLADWRQNRGFGAEFARFPNKFPC
jgi:hypothetical protein